MSSATLGLSIADAARVTSLSEKVVRAEVNAQRLPAHRVGTRIVILTADLETWLRRQPKVGE